MNEELISPAVLRVLQQVSAMSNIPMDKLFSGFKGGVTSDWLGQNPQKTTAAFVNVANELPPKELPVLLDATYDKIADLITTWGATSNKVSNKFAHEMGVTDPKINPKKLANRKFVESRVAGLLGHHLDKDKFGVQ